MLRCYVEEFFRLFELHKEEEEKNLEKIVKFKESCFYLKFSKVKKKFYEDYFHYEQ